MENDDVAKEQGGLRLLQTALPERDWPFTSAQIWKRAACQRWAERTNLPDEHSPYSICPFKNPSRVFRGLSKLVVHILLLLVCIDVPEMVVVH
jgi:hypothetical protein